MARRRSDRVSFSGNAYFRDLRTSTLNGDLNENSLDQSVYQPSPAEQAALAAAGYSGFPTSGATAANTPFPFWRCLGNVLLEDEPAQKCNGLINRGRTTQRTGGAAVQMMVRHDSDPRRNQLAIGTAFERSSTTLVQSTELGYLNPDRSVTGTGAFGDGENGGDVDGEPFDTRVDMTGTVTTWSAYASDTFSPRNTLHVTVSARYDHNNLSNVDQIRPQPGTGSLTGDNTFSRLNPAFGHVYTSAVVQRLRWLHRRQRAPAAVELMRRSRTTCKLPNAMAGDPPLEQVVAKTAECAAQLDRFSDDWRFHARNLNDLLRRVRADRIRVLQEFRRDERQDLR
jgi:hypothetical protein